PELTEFFLQRGFSYDYTTLFSERGNILFNPRVFELYLKYGLQLCQGFQNDPNFTPIEVIVDEFISSRYLIEEDDAYLNSARQIIDIIRRYLEANPAKCLAPLDRAISTLAGYNEEILVEL